MNLFWRGYVRSHNELKTFSFLSLKKYTHQTFIDRGFGWGAPSFQTIFSFGYKITCQLKHSVKIWIFVLQQSRTTKLGWEVTNSKMQYDHCDMICIPIMICIPLRVNVLAFCGKVTVITVLRKIIFCFEFW